MAKVEKIEIFTEDASFYKDGAFVVVKADQRVSDFEIPVDALNELRERGIVKEF